MSSINSNVSIDNDNIYYDVTISNVGYNNNFQSLPVEFLERRTQAILEKPDDYYLSVAKFSIDGADIPLMIFPIQTGQTQTNINLGIESVTLKYMNSENRQYLIYIPLTENPAPVPPSQNPPLYGQVVNGYYYIFEYQTYVNIINNALALAFASIPHPPAIPGNPIQAPFLIYNIEDQKFSMIAQTVYYQDTLPDAQRIDIFFNQPLINNLQGFNSNWNTNHINGKDAQILMQYTKNNLWNEPNGAPTFPALFLETKQQYNAITRLNSFSRLAITSNCLPITNEFLALKNSNGSNILLSSITDFTPLIQDSGQFKGIYVYTPSGVGNYRLIDMKSSEPLKLINLKLYWIDRYGNYYPLNQPFGSTCNIKLVFLKKDLYKKS